MTDWAGALERAEAYSPYLSRAVARHGDLVAMLAAGDGEGALRAARAAGAKSWRWRWFWPWAIWRAPLR